LGFRWKRNIPGRDPSASRAFLNSPVCRERLLGDAHAVGLGGIEAVDAGIEGTVHGLIELRGVDGAVCAADLPAAEADSGNLEVRGPAGKVGL
jgi:hypothetical protein